MCLTQPKPKKTIRGAPVALPRSDKLTLSGDSREACGPRVSLRTVVRRLDRRYWAMAWEGESMGVLVRLDRSRGAGIVVSRSSKRLWIDESRQVSKRGLRGLSVPADCGLDNTERVRDWLGDLEGDFVCARMVRLTSSAIVSTEDRETRSSVLSRAGDIAKGRARGFSFGSIVEYTVRGLDRTCSNAGACVRIMSEMEGAMDFLTGSTPRGISSVDELRDVEASSRDVSEPILDDVEIIGMVKVGFRVMGVVDGVREVVLVVRVEEGRECFSCPLRRLGDEGWLLSSADSDPLLLRAFRGNAPPSVIPGGGFGSGGWYNGW